MEKNISNFIIYISLSDFLKLRTLLVLETCLKNSTGGDDKKAEDQQFGDNENRHK